MHLHADQTYEKAELSTYGHSMYSNTAYDLYFFLLSFAKYTATLFVVY